MKSVRTKITISTAELNRERKSSSYVQCMAPFVHPTTGTLIFCRRDRNKPHGDAHRGSGVQWCDR